MTTYDSIGYRYSATRRADPRIERRIHHALGDAGTVLNVGAGAGAYEPAQTVLAAEPSRVMIDQRPAGSAPVIQACAEALPLGADAVDAAMAVLTVHHWFDLAAGLRELRRVARRRIVILSWRPERLNDYWLTAEYFRDAARHDADPRISVETISGLLGNARIRVDSVPIPHDCSDGFGAAYWRRPAAYLDPLVRAGISTFARTDPAALRPGLRKLERDLESGAWQRRHADLLQLDELDVGYCLLTAEFDSASL